MEQYDERTWFDPRTGDQVSLTYIGMVPDLPAALDEVPLLRHRLAVETAEVGALIEAHVVSVDSVPTLFQLLKVPIPDQETGQAFIAAFTVPKATCSVVLRIQCAEDGGRAGSREAAVFGQVGTDVRPHPYAPEVSGRLPWLVADDAQWDGQFPDHPLSRARAWAHRMIATARVDPEFARLPPFRPAKPGASETFPRLVPVPGGGSSWTAPPAEQAPRPSPRPRPAGEPRLRAVPPLDPQVEEPLDGTAGPPPPIWRVPSAEPVEAPGRHQASAADGPPVTRAEPVVGDLGVIGASPEPADEQPAEATAPDPALPPDLPADRTSPPPTATPTGPSPAPTAAKGPLPAPNAAKGSFAAPDAVKGPFAAFDDSEPGRPESTGAVPEPQFVTQAEVRPVPPEIAQAEPYLHPADLAPAFAPPTDPGPIPTYTWSPTASREPEFGAPARPEPPLTDPTDVHTTSPEPVPAAPVVPERPALAETDPGPFGTGQSTADSGPALGERPLPTFAEPGPTPTDPPDAQPLPTHTGPTTANPEPVPATPATPERPPHTFAETNPDPFRTGPSTADTAPAQPLDPQPFTTPAGPGTPPVEPPLAEPTAQPLPTFAEPPSFAEPSDAGLPSHAEPTDAQPIPAHAGPAANPEPPLTPTPTEPPVDARPFTTHSAADLEPTFAAPTDAGPPTADRDPAAEHATATPEPTFAEPIDPRPTPAPEPATDPASAYLQPAFAETAAVNRQEPHLNGAELAPAAPPLPPGIATFPLRGLTDQPPATAAPIAGTPPASPGDALHTVLVGLPVGDYLALWLGSEITYWRLTEPDLARERLGVGLGSRSEIDNLRFRETAMLSQDRHTLFLADRFRDRDGQLGGTTTKLVPATEEEAFAAVQDTDTSELYRWLGEIVLAAAERDEFVAIETGGWHVPRQPMVQCMLRTNDGEEWHSVVEASPVPVGAPVWRDQQPVDGDTQSLVSPATEQTLRAAGLLTRFAVATWPSHPLRLCLSFGPNPTLGEISTR
ncbi:hypothetical protein GCM10027436_76740 [Actinophytocola sediminis]